MAQRDESNTSNGAVDRLKAEARGLLGALGDRAMSSVQTKVHDTTGRLTDYVEGGAGPGLMAAATGTRSLAEGKSPVRSFLGAGVAAAKEKAGGLLGKGGKGGKGKKLKVVNIVESIDVGVPVSVAYNQWTQFADFPSFMKKVESVEQADEQKLNWKAQVFWSHRTWEATIQEQAPDDKIVWRSKGEKGYVDGAVTFHALAPNMTRILLVLEYHPQGLFEHTGNIWRAQGRRARLELKHFRRHVMSVALLHAEEVEGWRGVIEDGEVVQDHESAVAEQQDGEEQDGEEQDGQEQDAAEERDGQEQDAAEENGQQRSRRAASGRDRQRPGRRQPGGQDPRSEDDEADEGDTADEAAEASSAAPRRRRSAAGAQRSGRARAEDDEEERPRREPSRASTRGSER